MEIIIKIPEKLYKQITVEKKYFLEDGENLCTAVANGIPLPKRHGRLFDERDIVNGNYEVIGNRIYELEPIIEADKE